MMQKKSGEEEKKYIVNTLENRFEEGKMLGDDGFLVNKKLLLSFNSMLRLLEGTYSFFSLSLSPSLTPALFSASSIDARICNNSLVFSRFKTY